MELKSHPDVLIIGASTAGCATAESLRHEGFTGSITVLGNETSAPYNRPPLSKHVLLGEWESEKADIFTDGAAERASIDLHTDVTAHALNTAERSVSTSRGDISYGALVIATGARARQLPASVDPDHVALTLRTREDSVLLRERLENSRSVVVIGSGVLGSEIAAAARKKGCAVTIVGRSGALTLGSVRDLLTQRLERLHAQNDVELRLAEGVASITHDGTTAHVTLTSGEQLDADTVVAAVGAIPNVEWLESSGLTTSPALNCDSHGQCAENIYAVGDVAAWHDSRTGRWLPDEHQLTALQHSQAVARHIATGEKAEPPVPFFWSELYGVRFQAYGRFPAEAELVTTHGDRESGDFVALSMLDGLPHGVVASNMSRDFRQARPAVDATLSGTPAPATTTTPSTAPLGGQS
ncbi:NAD(P)/FAD-dependent oxidoreductase [Salinibacterium sp. UTAS2018]|uniref:NAD(P)/FAD-dependent oxidoreductase n=1 Tax=Salinibacterium sp. UTAS2018 TaxID=2508880 RepID=UPI00100974D0|nr:FAD-dependent oxidoreductase [Salinibacterium sp. UTAS2018]QAV70865.1 NAD(P)/FAD-dependent oxidoreductase [Salinibacterium sp. UTAS2018]